MKKVKNSHLINDDVLNIKRRIQLREHTMLGLKTRIKVGKKDKFGLLEELIKEYPELVYSHVFKFKEKGLDRIHLTSVGMKYLFKILKEHKSDLPFLHYAERLGKKGKQNLVKRFNERKTKK